MQENIPDLKKERKEDIRFQIERVHLVHLYI